jgi:hypothetical protein
MAERGDKEHARPTNGLLLPTTLVATTQRVVRECMYETVTEM